MGNYCVILEEEQEALLFCRRIFRQQRLAPHEGKCFPSKPVFADRVPQPSTAVARQAEFETVATLAVSLARPSRAVGLLKRGRWKTATHNQNFSNHTDRYNEARGLHL